VAGNYVSGKPPKEWKQADIIAILKSGKLEDNPKNYRPISLLSVMYKLMERIILSSQHSKPASVLTEDDVTRSLQLPHTWKKVTMMA